MMTDSMCLGLIGEKMPKRNSEALLEQLPPRVVKRWKSQGYLEDGHHFKVFTLGPSGEYGVYIVPGDSPLFKDEKLLALQFNLFEEQLIGLSHYLREKK